MANTCKKRQQAYRHVVLRTFASSLYCLIGKSGYELLSSNLGNALPSLRTVQPIISTKQRINEGEFQFDQLQQHLNEWKSKPYVRIQLDDTRIINQIEYDELTNRFLGFFLPLQNGIPECNAFILGNDENIKDAVANNTAANYAHRILALLSTLIASSLC